MICAAIRAAVRPEATDTINDWIPAFRYKGAGGVRRVFDLLRFVRYCPRCRRLEEKCNTPRLAWRLPNIILDPSLGPAAEINGIKARKRSCQVVPSDGLQRVNGFCRIAAMDFAGSPNRSEPVTIDHDGRRYHSMQSLCWCSTNKMLTIVTASRLDGAVWTTYVYGRSKERCIGW